MFHSAHIVDYYIEKIHNGFTIRNDKRIAKQAGHKPSGAQCHAVRKLCQLGYSLY